MRVDTKRVSIIDLAIRTWTRLIDGFFISVSYHEEPDTAMVPPTAVASRRIINGLAVTQTVSLRTTLKAFANSSPGRGGPQPARGGSVCFETLGSKVPQEILRNSEGVAKEFCGYETATQLLQSCVFKK